MTLELTITLIFALCLSVGRAHGQAGMLLDPTVGPQPPTGFRVAVATAPITADFSFSPSSGAWPLTVQFVDLTQGGPSGWAWNFGDGSATNTSQNPIHTYNSSSNFTAILVATGPGGSSSASHTLSVTNPLGVIQWVDTIRGTSSFTASSSGIATDSAGNVVSVGAYQGTVSIGTNVITSNATSIDLFIVKYTSQGELVWFKSIGNTGEDVALGVTTDSQDNIIVLGAYQGSVTFGATTLTNAGGLDIFVAKYTSSGTLIWVKGYGGKFDDLGTAVAVNTSDDILIATRFQSPTIAFGSTTLTNAGASFDIGLVKLSSSGSITWAKRYGGVNDDFTYGISVDLAGNVWITGQYYTSTDLGGGTLTSPGSGDCFIAKYSGTDGNYVWARVLGSTFSSQGRAIATDPNTGNIMVSGSFRGASDFGNGTVPSGGGGGGTLFLAGYGVSGTNLWTDHWGGDTLGVGDCGFALKVDTSTILALTGQFDSGMNFGGGFLPGKGYFVSTFTVSGSSLPVFRWAKRSNTINNSYGTGAAFDTVGHLTIGGVFYYTTDFGGISNTVPPGTTGAFASQYMK